VLNGAVPKVMSKAASEAASKAASKPASNGRVRPHRRPHRPLHRCIPVLAAVVLLTGCGVAGTQFHPGVAAQVGDDTITTRHINEVSNDYCQAVEAVTEGQSGQANPPTAMRFLIHEFATDLIIRSAAEQLAEEYDVEPTDQYQRDLAALEPQLTELSDDQRDAVLEIIGAQSYTDDVLTQIGGIELDDQGSDDASPEDQQAAGQEVLAQWIADNDVEVNPKYGIELGTAGQVDTDLSYPLGETAKAGLDPEAGADYVSSLPGHLVCLD
jgi:peptidyl-prolyl cis-trans isomerase SurA